MATLHELRIEAGLSIHRLAQLADVDRNTVTRAEEGRPIQEVKAYAIVQAIARQLGRSIKLSEVDDLQVL